MTKEYNEWYWRLYRWVRWELPYQHKYIKYGVENLWNWFWVIWKDREWDYNYYWKIQKKKISQMRNYHAKNMRFESSDRTVEQMDLALSLIDKLQNDYYRDEGYSDEYYQTKMRVEDGKIEFDDVKNELSRYIEKYPSAHRQVLNNPKYLKYSGGEDSDFKISMLMGIERHNKAKRILFELFENNIESWWN
jgi:hypothetical protein